MQRPGPRNRLLNRDPRNNKLSSNLSQSSYVSSWNTITDWSAFNPLSLSPVFWLDASDTSTITASGGAVSQWNDKSGNNYHATQVTLADRPTTGVATQNNRNVLSFDGTDFMNAGVPTNVEPLSIVAVARATNNVNRTVYGGDQTVLPTLGLNATSLINLSSPGVANIGTSTIAVDTVNYYVMTATYAANGQFQIFLNNQPVGGGTNDQYFFSGLTRIGADRTFNLWIGQIAEIYKFHKVLTNTELNTLHSYLQWKWALQF